MMDWHLSTKSDNVPQPKSNIITMTKNGISKIREMVILFGMFIFLTPFMMKESSHHRMTTVLY